MSAAQSALAVLGRSTLLAILLSTTSCGRKESAADNMTAEEAAVEDTAAEDLNVAPQDPPTDNITYLATFALKQTPAPNAPMLRNGRVANTAEWLASFYAVFQTARGRAACTSALIGPRVMLTAAHCIPPNGSVQFIYGPMAYRMACVAHGDWLSGADPSADYALCQLLDDFIPPPGFQYETVDVAPMMAMVNKSIILTGFGCIGDAVKNSPTDGKYRIGLNSVDETSSSTSRKRDPRYYSGSGNQKNNLFTTDVGANVCPGDSGGPAFRRTAGGGESQYGQRKIVGVNSRVFYRDPQRTTYGSSLISSTGTPSFTAWADKWLGDRGLDACGLRGAVPACRT